MDGRLIAVIDRLAQDLDHMEKVLLNTQKLLRELSKEVRKNGETQERQMTAVIANQKFLANQFPRVDGTYPLRAWRENDEEQ